MQCAFEIVDTNGVPIVGRDLRTVRPWYRIAISHRETRELIAILTFGIDAANAIIPKTYRLFLRTLLSLKVVMTELAEAKIPDCPSVVLQKAVEPFRDYSLRIFMVKEGFELHVPEDDMASYKYDGASLLEMLADEGTAMNLQQPIQE